MLNARGAIVRHALLSALPRASSSHADGSAAASAARFAARRVRAVRARAVFAAAVHRGGARGARSGWRVSFWGVAARVARLQRRSFAAASERPGNAA